MFNRLRKNLYEESMHKARLNLLRGKVLEIGFAQTPDNFKDYSDGELYGVDVQEMEKPSWYREIKKTDLNKKPIPYPNGFFDTVFAGDLILHVASPLALLSECNRVLGGNGRLIMVLINPHYYWHIFTTIFLKYFNFVDDQHLCSFTRYDIRNILRKSGFVLTKEMGYGFELVKLHWKLSLFKFPGLAGKILYVAEKKSNPEKFVTVEDSQGGKRRVISL